MSRQQKTFEDMNNARAALDFDHSMIWPRTSWSLDSADPGSKTSLDPCSARLENKPGTRLLQANAAARMFALKVYGVFKVVKGKVHEQQKSRNRSATRIFKAMKTNCQLVKTLASQACQSQESFNESHWLSVYESLHHSF
jgi:hypothetical protein